MLELCHDHADDDHTSKHDERPDQKHGLAAELVDDQHSGDGTDEENDTGHTGCEESNGAACESQTDEDIGGVVNN